MSAKKTLRKVVKAAKPAKREQNPLMPIASRVLVRRDEAPGSFTIVAEYASDNKPGQFVQVSLPGMGECPISIASNDQKRLELNINRVGNVTSALQRVRQGETLFIRGPYGKGYPMEELEGKRLILIGGGCGVASIRGVVHYLLRNKDRYKDVRTFVGFRSHDLILFREELPSWEGVGELNISLDTAKGITEDPSVKQVNVALKKGAVSCEVGFVTKMLHDATFDINDSAVLMCGPPLMIKFSIRELKAHGFRDNQIYVSAERLMYCGIGKCCHCMIHGKFTCLDGPVFRLDTLGEVE